MEKASDYPFDLQADDNVAFGINHGIREPVNRYADRRLSYTREKDDQRI